VAEKNCDFQRILLRTNPKGAIKKFRLKTVKYEIGPASYLNTAYLKENFFLTD